MGGCLGKPEPGPGSVPAPAPSSSPPAPVQQPSTAVATSTELPASSKPVAVAEVTNGKGHSIDAVPCPTPPAVEEPAPTTTTTTGATDVVVDVEAVPGLDAAPGESQPANSQHAAPAPGSTAGDVFIAPAGPMDSNLSASRSGAASQLGDDATQWDKAKLMFSLTRPEELLNDLHDLKYIGAGGYGKVFKAVWRSAPVAVKLVPSHSPELFKSSSYKEALLCKELCHPNIVQTYETRCAQLSEEFVHSILSATEAPLQAQKMMSVANGAVSGGASYGSQEFVSGDGFGLPSPVPDMVVKGRTLPEAAAKWKDILFATGAKAGDYLTVIIMDFCDYGSLVRPIMKGMFRPFSASGSDREARVRYRALLRTAKEIAQGLEHLHHLKVVHGDLKPGNVLLKGSRSDVRGFTAQVIDFGLSHMVNNSNPQKVSKAGGTLVYAAPEVFSGRVGKSADVYSLGIILWEMVTGSQPYKDMVEGQIVLGVQKGGLRPAWPPGQLAQLQELYERCVAQDPDLRPKAKEVVQYLTQIEMDLRAELRAAHKQAQAAQLQQAMHAQQAAGAQLLAAQQQQAAAMAAQHQQMQMQAAAAAQQHQHAASQASYPSNGDGQAPHVAPAQQVALGM